MAVRSGIKARYRCFCLFLSVVGTGKEGRVLDHSSTPGAVSQIIIYYSLYINRSEEFLTQRGWIDGTILQASMGQSPAGSFVVLTFFLSHCTRVRKAAYGVSDTPNGVLHDSFRLLGYQNVDRFRSSFAFFFLRCTGFGMAFWISIARSSCERSTPFFLFFFCFPPRICCDRR